MLGDLGAVRVEGSYGFGESRSPASADALRDCRDLIAAAGIEGVWVEDKGASIAIHYRNAGDPSHARGALLGSAEAAAVAHEMALIEGKMVLELVPGNAPRKGGVVLRLVAESRLSSILYAGDDAPDLEAFEALDELGAEGAGCIKVAVRGPETPASLVDAADLVVDGPLGLVSMLEELVTPRGS